VERLVTRTCTGDCATAQYLALYTRPHFTLAAATLGDICYCSL